MNFREESVLRINNDGFIVNDKIILQSASQPSDILTVLTYERSVIGHG